MRYCQNCKKQLEDSDEYCTECGVKQEDQQGTNDNYCNRCGTLLEDDDYYCTECGNHISECVDEELFNYEETKDDFTNPSVHISDDRQEVAEKYKINNKNNKKDNVNLLKGMLIIVLVIAIGSLGTLWYLYFNNQISNNNSSSTEPVTEQVAKEPDTEEPLTEISEDSESITTELTTNESVTVEPTSEKTDIVESVTKGTDAEIFDSTTITEQEYNLYFIVDSNSRYLTKEDLIGMSAYELMMARNEIYARKGRGFQDASIQAYFDSQSWYTKIYDPEEFDAYGGTLFNDYEYQNILTIRSYESEQGY